MILPPPGHQSVPKPKPRRLPPQGPKRPNPKSHRRRRPKPDPTLFGPDPLSWHYASRLEGVYDCIDRLTINAYFPIARLREVFDLVARPVRLGRPSRQYPPDAPGRPVQPPHAGLGQEARDSGDRLLRRRTEA